MSPRDLRRWWLAIGWAGVAVIAFYSLKPDPPDLGIEQGDKFQHLVAYGGSMGWFAQVRSPGSERRITALALVAMGIALEIAQGLTGYREYSYADMAANTTGVLLGWLLAPPRLPSAFDFASRILSPTAR